MGRKGRKKQRFTLHGRCDLNLGLFGPQLNVQTQVNSVFQALYPDLWTLPMSRFASLYNYHLLWAVKCLVTLYIGRCFCWCGRWSEWLLYAPFFQELAKPNKSHERKWAAAPAFHYMGDLEQLANMAGAYPKQKWWRKCGGEPFREIVSDTLSIINPNLKV